MVVSKLNEEMLSRIAGITEGAYVRATKQSIGLDEIVESINRLEQSELAAVRFEEYNEQYQYLLAAALLLLVVELLLLDRRNPLLARFNIFAPQSGPANPDRPGDIPQPARPPKRMTTRRTAARQNSGTRFRFLIFNAYFCPAGPLRRRRETGGGKSGQHRAPRKLTT